MVSFINKLSFIIFTLLILPIVASAEDVCTYKDKAGLNDIASNISINYEVIELEEEIKFNSPDTGEPLEGIRVKTIFKISIYNLTEDVFIIQSNDFDNKEEFIIYELSTNGVYTFETDDVENIIKYKFDVISALPGCFGDILKSYNFIKPKKNMYSQYAMCEGNENIPYCQEFITEEIPYSASEINELIDYRVDNVIEATKVTDNNAFINFIKDYYLYIIIGFGLLALTITGYVIYLKRRIL